MLQFALVFLGHRRFKYQIAIRVSFEINFHILGHLERSSAASEATRDEMQEFRVDMARGIGSLTSSVESYGRLTLGLVALAMLLLAGAAGLNVYFSAGGATVSASQTVP